MISVCIPCWESHGYGVKFMSQLLDSIVKQKGAEFEVIVSDNSRDDLIEILCKRYGCLNLKYFRNNETFGTSNNTNNAIAHASHDLIKIMYSDDLLISPIALQQFEKALGKGPWAVSQSYFMDKAGRLKQLRKPSWNKDLLKGQNTIGMPSVMAMRRNEFSFDPNLTTLLDCEFYWLMYRRYGSPEIINLPLVAQRFWDGSMSSTLKNRRVEDYEYLKFKHDLNSVIPVPVARR